MVKRALQLISLISLTFMFLGAIVTLGVKAATDGNVLMNWETVLQDLECRYGTNPTILSSGYLYIIGGYKCSYPENDILGRVDKAVIDENGNVSEWTQVSRLPANISSGAAVASGEYIYSIGGATQNTNSSFPVSTGIVARTNVQLDGSLSSWGSEPPLAFPRFNLNAIVVGNYIYAVGGQTSYLNSLEPSSNIVERAEIKADGSLGTWTLEKPLNEGRSSFGIVHHNKFIYVFGGDEYFHDPISSIERAEVLPDGSLADWEIVGDLPSQRSAFGFIKFEDEVYIIGGFEWDHTKFSSSVEKCLLSSNDFGNTCHKMPELLNPQASLSAVSFNSYIYTIANNRIDRAELISDVVPPLVTSFRINSGALSTTSPEVQLDIEAEDLSSGVSRMSFSNNGTDWSPWQEITSTLVYTLPGGDGIKNVYARVDDNAGNISQSVLQNIQLASKAGQDFGLTINSGNLFTNKVEVSLTVSAKPFTPLMQVSNDGGFSNAVWEPYSAVRDWEITKYGNYVIPRVVYVRFKDLQGQISPIYQDDIILDVEAPTGSLKVHELESSTTRAGNERVQAEINQTYSGLTIFLPTVLKDFNDALRNPPNVTLEITAKDALSGVGQMSICYDPKCTTASWVPFEKTINWYLPAEQGTLYIRFKDNAGNVSQVYPGQRIQK